MAPTPGPFTDKAEVGQGDTAQVLADRSEHQRVSVSANEAAAAEDGDDDGDDDGINDSGALRVGICVDAILKPPMADDEISLPKATLQKMIKDFMPGDTRLASEAVDMIVGCCTGQLAPSFP